MSAADLDKLTARLNRACGRPIVGYSEVPTLGSRVFGAYANIGYIHVRGEQQGNVVRYRLVVVINEAGGCTTLAGPKTAAALAKYLNTLCVGAELVRALPIKTGVTA